jgi:hypothetical protein
LFQIAPKSSPLLTTTTIKNIKTNKFSFLWIFFSKKIKKLWYMYSRSKFKKYMKISRQKIISWWFCCVCQFDARMIFVGLFGRDGKRCDKGKLFWLFIWIDFSWIFSGKLQKTPKSTRFAWDLWLFAYTEYLTFFHNFLDNFPLGRVNFLEFSENQAKTFKSHANLVDLGIFLFTNFLEFNFQNCKFLTRGDKALIFLRKRG